MDNSTRHTLRLIRNQLEELDDFVLRSGSVHVIPGRWDRQYVEVTIGDVLEQLDTLIDRTPFSYREPVEESDYVCCS